MAGGAKRVEPVAGGARASPTPVAGAGLAWVGGEWAGGMGGGGRGGTEGALSTGEGVYGQQ